VRRGRRARQQARTCDRVPDPQHEYPVKEQFDTEDEARAFIQQNYSDTFKFDFEFSRVGWQYDLNGDQVGLEEIEGYASIEYKSPTENGLRALLDTFGVVDDEVLKGPSVIEMRNRIVHPIL
jgi:hypothetical protein